MKNFILPENMKQTIIQALSTSKNDKITFGEMYQLISQIEKLEEVKEKEEVKK